MTKARVIAYQGEPGANSHRLRRQLSGSRANAVRDLRGRVRHPTTVSGRSRDDPDRELDRRARGRHPRAPAASGLHIVGETFLPIHFQLLAVPGARIEDLKTVHSHVHALGQCRNIIRRHRLKPVVSSDTAGSAREVAEGGDKSRASLATRLAAQIYGLQTLVSDVEDESHNTTRFVVLSKDPRWAPQGNGAVVTTFVFRVRNVPAALYKALGGFATNSVNMTKLESYMVEGEFSATQFLADVDGHPRRSAAEARARGTRVLLAGSAILGVYPAHPFRAETQNGG